IAVLFDQDYRKFILALSMYFLSYESDTTEYQHDITRGHRDGITSVHIRTCPGARTLDLYAHSGQGIAILTGHFSSDNLLHGFLPYRCFGFYRFGFIVFRQGYYFSIDLIGKWLPFEQ